MTTIKPQNAPFRFFSTKRITNRQANSTKLVPETLRRPKFLNPRVNMHHLWVTPLPNKLARLTIATKEANRLLSLFLRKIFENRHFKTLIGVHLAILAMASGFIQSHSALASLVFIPQTRPGVFINQPKVDLITKESVVRPLSEYRITQGFSLFHPGIDLGVETGTPVHPVISGVVIEAGWAWIGYGNTIVVDHQNGYSSRYAHLSKMFIKLGEKVTTDTVIGLSGSTGHSSGPHLHLEIADHGLPINPRSLLE